MKSLNNLEQLNGLIATLEAQDKLKKDMVANSSQHLLFFNGMLQVMEAGKPVIYTPTQHFHSQLAEKLDIPSGYYKKMLADQSSILDENVNHWLLSDSKNFLVRAFKGANDANGVARAFLSDRYSIMDNYAVLLEALEAIKATGLKIEVVNAELSDTRMYLKVVCPDVEVSGREMIKAYRVNKEVGDGVISGFTLSNSEIGAGAFNIMPRALVLTCKNGATMAADALKNIHLGSKMDQLGFSQNKDVMRANLRLVKEQIKHAVKIFLSKEYLTKLVNTYATLGEPKIEAPVQNVIEVVGREYSISQERKANILKYFIEGGDTRRMGLASAMTREAQGLEDADARHDTETLAEKVLVNFKAIEAKAMKVKTFSN